MKPEERIILAIDVPGYDEAAEVMERFKDHIEIFKIGSELFTSAGPRVVEKAHSFGKKVFLDLKFHDIPNTVAKSALAAARLGVFMFNVHTFGGIEMMKRAVEAIREYSLKENTDRPKIIGVTVLTSMDSATLTNELGIQAGMSTQVKHLAGLAERAGLDGVVASAEEAEIIRSRFGKDFLIVTPGIRPSWAAKDDQKRALTPKEALRRGSDYLVIGRSITAQPNPAKALERIHNEMTGL